jgi:Holliday junction resolvase
MSNNAKKWGLSKEREVKKIIEDEGAMAVRSRGSFGAFDLICFYPAKCKLISVKATKQKTFSVNAELKKLRQIKLPDYCRGELWVYYSPNSERKNKSGWKRYEV